MEKSKRPVNRIDRAGSRFALSVFLDPSVLNDKTPAVFQPAPSQLSPSFPVTSLHDRPAQLTNSVRRTFTTFDSAEVKCRCACTEKVSHAGPISASVIKEILRVVIMRNFLKIMSMCCSLIFTKAMEASV